MTSKQQRRWLLERLILITDKHIADVFMGLVDSLVDTACAETSAYHAREINETAEIMMRGEATRDQVMLHAILSGAFSNVKGSP